MEKKYNHSTLFLYLLICLIPISCIRREESPQKETIQPKITVKKDTMSRHLKGFPILFPVNEATQQPLLEQTIARLLVIVKTKNTDSLLNYITEDVQISFDGKDGLNAFKVFWKLSEEPENSDLWNILEKILKLGGSFYHEDAFFMPYTFSRFPAEYNPDDFGVVTSEKALMFARPEESADSIAKLTYEIVRIVEKEGEWMQIKRQNEITGYVKSRDISCPTDYRLGLKRVNEVWKISFLTK